MRAVEPPDDWTVSTTQQLPTLGPRFNAFLLRKAVDQYQITYDGDLSDLKVKIGAPAEIRDTDTREHVHGFRWDGNVSRLTFDPDTTTDMQLELRPAGRWPRLRRRPSVPRG